MSADLHPDFDLATACAREAGEILLAEFGGNSIVNAEVGRDIKLAADVLAERAILNRLRANSPHPILSEEAGADAGLERGTYQWIVDPLDGTFNFSRRLPWCCVSIGLWQNEEPVLGVVHDFVGKQTYAGVVGRGAWCNDEPMRVSDVNEPARAALCTGFPVGREFGEPSLRNFINQVQAYKKLRLVGSAALSLALVAAGCVEAYHEEDINFWDVAAGLALVRAAGGRFTMAGGRSRWQRRVFASNGRLPEPDSACIFSQP